MFPGGIIALKAERAFILLKMGAFAGHANALASSLGHRAKAQRRKAAKFSFWLSTEALSMFAFAMLS
jgi:hypothetical protein